MFNTRGQHKSMMVQQDSGILRSCKKVNKRKPCSVQKILPIDKWWEKSAKQCLQYEGGEWEFTFMFASFVQRNWMENQETNNYGEVNGKGADGRQGGRGLCLFIILYFEPCTTRYISSWKCELKICEVFVFPSPSSSHQNTWGWFSLPPPTLEQKQRLREAHMNRKCGAQVTQWFSLIPQSR